MTENSKLDNKKAFLPIGQDEKKEQAPKEQEQEMKDPEGEPSLEQKEGGPDGPKQSEYKEPDQDDLISEDELMELEQSLMKDGLHPDEAEEVIQSHLSELKKMHKQMHDSGELKEFLEQQIQKDHGDNPKDEDQDSQQQKGQENLEEDQKGTNIKEEESDPQTEEPSEPEGKVSASGEKGNPDLMSHYMKMHEQSQKHLQDMMKNFAGSKKNG